MKVPKADENVKKNEHKRTRQQRRRDSDYVNEMLKLCLQKICELQANLQNEESMHDAEAAGYSACVMETLRFLSTHGLPPDHPVVKAVREKLLRNRD